MRKGKYKKISVLSDEDSEGDLFEIYKCEKCGYEYDDNEEIMERCVNCKCKFEDGYFRIGKTNGKFIKI